LWGRWAGATGDSMPAAAPALLPQRKPCRHMLAAGPSCGWRRLQVAGRVIRVEHVDNYKKRKAEVGGGGGAGPCRGWRGALQAPPLALLFRGAGPALLDITYCCSSTPPP
jgi:hypothetical protein